MTIEKNATIDQVELRPGEQFIELQYGHRAILRNPHDVPESRRRPLKNLAATAGEARDELKGIAEIVGERKAEELSPDEFPSPSENILTLMSESVDLLILAAVREWTYGPKVDLATLLDDDFPGADYDTLTELTAPMFNEIMPTFGPGNGGVVRKEDGGIEVNEASPSQPSSV